MKHAQQLKDMISMAKEFGLKRLKIGSLEIEVSDLVLVTEYAKKLETSENLTNNSTVTETPSQSPDANTLLTEDEDDDSLLFHSTI